MVARGLFRVLVGVGVVWGAVAELHVATSASQLPDLTAGAEAVFFDVDETLVLPESTFIYGLPRSDAFIAGLDECLSAGYSTLSEMMEEAYYRAPLRLVHKDLPRIIAELQARGVRVYGVTSRSATGKYAWHNQVVLDFLEQQGVRFTSAPGSVNGVFFVADEEVVGGRNQPGRLSGKAVVIDSLLTGGQGVLVDNTLAKLHRAMEQSQSNLSGVHYTEAWTQEASWDSMVRWICDAAERA
eukprot:Sspe_Gene.73890::Locus_45091_Transcript_1_1_Confidence_1.000_Length_767::g.73890::m.73890